MKRLKSNRLSHLAYGETFPTELQKRARVEHEINLKMAEFKQIITEFIRYLGRNGTPVNDDDIKIEEGKLES